MTRAPEINALIQEEIDKVNHQVSRVENIRKFRIIDKKLYTEDGEVTPTMKVKRKSINAQFGDLIESMYKDWARATGQNGIWTEYHGYYLGERSAYQERTGPEDGC